MGWEVLSKYLQDRKDHLIVGLVASDNDQTRGRIKEINDLLELPSRLQQEAIHLQEAKQEAEIP